MQADRVCNGKDNVNVVFKFSSILIVDSGIQIDIGKNVWSKRFKFAFVNTGSNI